MYCLEDQRTPFDLHQFVARYTTRLDAEVSIGDCRLLMDWCFLVAHRTAAASPTTSVLAISLQAAPSDDDHFLRWLYKIDSTRDGEHSTGSVAVQAAGPAAAAPAYQKGAAVAPPPQSAPTPDVWAQMAKTISTSFATAAAALKTPTTDASGALEESSGGVEYDKFQIAALQGFLHAHYITGVPIIWAMFQQTKNIETHKDNLRRKMEAWATDPSRPIQVPIERGLYIPDATMKEIISLNFNPGGVMADAETADLGMSILICRARTTAAKTAIRRHERALAQSRRNRSMAEAEAEQTTTTVYDTGSLPDNYHELLQCLGTYCALLHALFGDRCVFYRQCYELWSALNSDLVYEQRNDFSALFCRQIVWAIVMESRVYFSKRLSVDDFQGVHPDDIAYPTCKLQGIVQHVCDVTPIARASFPAAWYPSGTAVSRAPATMGGAQGGTVVLVQSIATGGGAAATVVSGITAGSARTPRPPATIRTTDINPQIKAAMEAYIAKNKGVYLTAILNHVNLSLEDLPKVAPEVCGTNGICYNYILGCCNMDRCQHEHVHARDISDEFASELLTKLRPGITEFTANGLPPGTHHRRRVRQRTST